MFWFAADFGSQERVCSVRRKRLSSRQRHLYSPFQVFRHVSFFHSVMCTEAANFQHHVTNYQLFEASRQGSEHEHCLHSRAFCFPDEAQDIGASAFVFFCPNQACVKKNKGLWRRERYLCLEKQSTRLPSSSPWCLWKIHHIPQPLLPEGCTNSGTAAASARNIVCERWCFISTSNLAIILSVCVCLRARHTCILGYIVSDSRRDGRA
jgi:hypothetical protein